MVNIVRTVWNKFRTKSSHDNDVAFVVRQQIDKHGKVLESLKLYDQGKKEISTTRFHRNFKGL